MTDMSTTPLFQPGANIAMKVPADAFDATVAFYTETLGFRVESRDTSSVVIDFDGKHLWIDRVETIEKSEVWLEVATHDLAAASSHLAAKRVERCDEVESLPEGMAAFWIKNPAAVVHLVTETAS
jgi:catechol 2,3-dioxygenase-like lactoylglutathione lyase family enzyme